MKKRQIPQKKGTLLSKLDFDEKNSLYYEYEEGNQNAYTYVLTGNTSAWNGL